MARSVVQAQKKINGLNTSPTGTISVHRSNGTKDIYGVLNKDGYSVAKNVGDTVAPPKPKGIFATSSSDVVYVAWDGTLEDKIPSDFYNVTIYMGVDGQSSVIGALTEPGIVSTPPLPTAQSVEIWATAEDDTCKEDGTPAHNVSPESTHQSVAIEHRSNSQGVEDLKRILEKKIDAVDVKAEQAATNAKGAKTMATEASNKAEEVKATVDNLSNAFSHDARGAYVGDKTKQFVWVNKDGVWLMDGKTLNASFTSKRASLAGDKLIIAADQIVVTNASSSSPDVVKKGTSLCSESIGLTANDTVFLHGQTLQAQIAGTNILLNNQGLRIMPVGKSLYQTTSINDLVKLLKFTGWTTLQDDGACRVRYCIRGGMMYLDCYLAAGYSARTTTAEMPDNLLPAIEGYYPMGTETGDHTAKIWIGAAGGGNKRIYLYNNSTGYATGIIPILPKSME
jgi:hypothetical protein